MFVCIVINMLFNKTACVPLPTTQVTLIFFAGHSTGYGTPTTSTPGYREATSASATTTATTSSGSIASTDTLSEGKNHNFAKKIHYEMKMKMTPNAQMATQYRQWP